jgi:16S rRNA (cytidine1402-2'-O)-methyltransferase
MGSLFIFVPNTTMSKLYLVPTPIGNLKDMTIRALEVLESADLILAEDTRTSKVLLNNYSISTQLRSFHIHNEHQKVDEIITQISQGETVALISDAGTPGISDPGFLLVRAAIANEIPMECLPGPTALIPALVVSGFPTDRFIFEGFLPPKKGRIKRIQSWISESRTIIVYESPHRLTKLFVQMNEHLAPDRHACIVRELSKKFESIYRGEISSLLTQLTLEKEIKVKGEFVVVIDGYKNKNK